MANKPCLSWLLAALVAWLAAFFVPAFAPVAPGALDWRWALPYGVFGALLLGMQFRLRPALPPALNRLLALVAGVVALLLALALGYKGSIPQVPFFSALVGVAAVVLLARIAPAPLARLWFGGLRDKETT